MGDSQKRLLGTAGYNQEELYFHELNKKLIKNQHEPSPPGKVLEFKPRQKKGATRPEDLAKRAPKSRAA